MVVTRLIGGLGNQLFQYAAGRRLAHARGVALKQDPAGLDDPAYRTARTYALAPFALAQAFATPDEVATLTRPRRGALARLLRRPASPPASYVRERHFHFDPAVLDLPDGVYLAGYWQSERYFADAADVIRSDLALRDPPEGRNRALLDRIGACQAVSVHVRRGDFVTDPGIHAAHGACGADYYEKAAAHLADRVERPAFFVFSDEPDWARAHLKLPGPVEVVDHNGPGRAAEDLRLMAACRHHVIANSTFGWWGAWLDPRPDKRVVAPARWFAGYAGDTRDLCPPAWVRL